MAKLTSALEGKKVSQTFKFQLSQGNRKSALLDGSRSLPTACNNMKNKNLTGCIKDEDGSILMDEESVKRRWTTYIKGLCSDDGMPR